MQITYRQYPYPVLTYFNDDYKNCSFISNVTSNAENNKIKLNISFNLTSKTLSQLIRDEKAVYLVHLECKSTRFRKKYETYDDSITIDIDGNNVKYEVEVSIFIAAKANISEFKSGEFNDDFSGISFNIEPGDVLALDRSIKINIDKTGDSLKKMPSIFSIVPDEKCRGTIRWTDDGCKIIIHLSKDNFSKYKILRNRRDFADVMASIIVIPVLTEIICNIQNDENCYAESLWIRVIKDRLKAVGIDSHEKIQGKDSSDLAYKLLDGLLDKSFLGVENCVEREDE